MTAPYAIAVDAVSFVASALFVGFIRKPEPPVPPPEGGTHPRMRTQIAEGFGFLWRHPLLRPIAMATATSNLFSSIMQAVYLVYAVRRLHLSPGTIGAILAVANVGFLVGAVTAVPLARRIGV